MTDSNGDPEADPPDESPYLALDPALRETLKRSFADRIAGAPDASINLMFGFPAAPKPPPATTWEALDYLGLTAVNFLGRLFERIRNIDGTLTTWAQIKYIRNQWWQGSAGMKVVYFDPPSARECLDGLLSGANGKKVARDAYVGAMEHQSTPLPALLRDLAQNPSKANAAPPDCDTWREIDKLGDEGTHFCIGKDDLKTPGSARHVSADDIHLDWMNPVQGIDSSTHKCSYNWGTGVEHWWQATQGKGVPIFTFDAIDGYITDWETVNAARTNVTAELRDFAKRWRAARVGFAVTGRAGYDRSMSYYQELTGLMKKGQSRFAAFAPGQQLMRAIADLIPSKSPPLDPRT